MQIDWIELSRAVPYAGIAIIFAVFVLVLQEKQDKKDREREQRDDAREAARTLARRTEQERQDAKDISRDERFIKAFSDLARDWQETLGNYTSQQSQGMALISRELERIGNVGMLTNALVKEHDTWERAVFEAGRRRGDTGPLGERKAG